jgi:hypothetical protein
MMALNESLAQAGRKQMTVSIDEPRQNDFLVSVDNLSGMIRQLPDLGDEPVLNKNIALHDLHSIEVFIKIGNDETSANQQAIHG